MKKMYLICNSYMSASYLTQSCCLTITHRLDLKEHNSAKNEYAFTLSSSEIRMSVFVEMCLSNGCSAVNGCRQNENITAHQLTSGEDKSVLICADFSPGLLWCFYSDGTHSLQSIHCWDTFLQTHSSWSRMILKMSADLNVWLDNKAFLMFLSW